MKIRRIPRIIIPKIHHRKDKLINFDSTLFFGKIMGITTGFNQEN